MRHLIREAHLDQCPPVLFVKVRVSEVPPGVLRMDIGSMVTFALSRGALIYDVCNILNPRTLLVG